MNKLILSILLGTFSSINCYAQEKKIPQSSISPVISQYIQTNYPNAKKLQCYSETKNHDVFIECEFHYNKIEYSVKFFHDSLVETELEMPFSSIPNPAEIQITQYLKTEFNKFKIKECQKIILPHSIQFELLVKSKKNEFYEIIFTETGAIFSKNLQNPSPISSQF